MMMIMPMAMMPNWNQPKLSIDGIGDGGPRARLILGGFMPKRKKISAETRDGILQCIRYMDDDAKIAAYIAAPHEGISAADIARIRRRELSHGRATKQFIHGRAAAAMEPLAPSIADLRAERHIRRASDQLAQAIAHAHA